MVLNRKQRRAMRAGKVIEVSVPRSKEELDKDYAKECAELGSIVVKINQVQANAQKSVGELQKQAEEKIEAINKLQVENLERLAQEKPSETPQA